MSFISRVPQEEYILQKYMRMICILIENVAIKKRSRKALLICIKLCESFLWCKEESDENVVESIQNQWFYGEGLTAQEHDF